MRTTREMDQHDHDIRVLSSVNSRVSSTPGMHFVVTGSHSIEALTQSPGEHNDIDGNIFTADLAHAKTVARTLEKNHVLETDDRFEFELEQGSGDQAAPRRLEVCLIETIGTPVEQGVFYLKNKRGDSFAVPTTLASLRDSGGKDFVFRVKSLPYAIATWAIRISGAAQNQKRPIKDSDVENLSLLLAKGYELTDVISAMRRHPQMPVEAVENEVLERALAIVSDRLK